MSEQRPGTARTARPSPDAGTWPARHAAPAAGEAVETESAGSAPVQKNAHHQTQASNIGLGPVVPAATHLTPDMPLNHHHDDRIPQVERLADLLRREVFAVRRLGAHSLVVTLKPDPETEFLFRVTQRDGHIEAQLQIERGDPAALLPHWHHLTEALARQGVRLLPLMAAPGFTSETPTTLTPPPAVSLSANDQPPSHPRRSNREPMEELPPAGPRTEPLSRRRSRARARSPHQFERWA